GIEGVGRRAYPTIGRPGLLVDGWRQPRLSAVGDDVAHPPAINVPGTRGGNVGPVVEPRLTLLPDLPDRRLRQHLDDRRFDPRIVGIDVHTDQAMRGTPADDADAGVALAPGDEIFSAREAS